MHDESHDDRTWTTLGEASQRLVAGLASRVGKGRPAEAGGVAPRPGSQAAQADATEERGGRRAERSTAAKVPPQGIGGGAAGEH
jgi:hypothetical protein